MGSSFYRILNSRIHDWYRHRKLRNRYRSWLTSDSKHIEDPIQTAPAPKNTNPKFESQTNKNMIRLQSALTELSARQQQALLLRAWEDLYVRQTTIAMNCTEAA
jgi:RNA polymerase sigma-70 factor (ECF subfamily)